MYTDRACVHFIGETAETEQRGYGNKKCDTEANLDLYGGLHPGYFREIPSSLRC